MPEEQETQHRCTTCNALSPPITEGDTFLSTRYGWRLHRFANEKGQICFEWRCPACWARFKSTKLGSPVEPPPSSTRGRLAGPDPPRPSSGVYSLISDQAKGGKGSQEKA